MHNTAHVVSGSTTLAGHDAALRIDFDDDKLTLTVIKDGQELSWTAHTGTLESSPGERAASTLALTLERWRMNSSAARRERFR